MRELAICGSSILRSLNAPPPPPSHYHRRRRRLHSPKRPDLSPSKPLPPPSSPSRRPLLTAVRRRDIAARLNYYSTLASKLAGEGRIEHFLMIAEGVVGSGLEPREFVSLLNTGVVSAGISRAIGCHGKVWSVVEVLRNVEKLGISPLVLCDGLAKEALARECRRIVDSGNVVEAIELMEILAGFRYPVKELVEPLGIVKACVGKRDPDMAIRYARILPHAHIVLCTIIHEFGKKKDLLSALTAFEASKQNIRSPNTYVYRMIIDVCGLCGDYIRSRHVYEELLAQNFTPNVFVFNSLMNANAHDLSYALHVYRQMKSLGVTPDVASYNILLKACCLARRVDMAQNIYWEVQQLESTGALKLDVFTYSTIIKVLSDAKMWQVALKVKEDMMSAGVTPNTVTWSSLISACANAGLIEQAIQLFNEMIFAGCEPNSLCFNILLHACVEACQYDRAFRFFRSWKESGLKEFDFIGNVDHVVGMERVHGNSIMTNTAPESNSPSFARRFSFIPTTSTYNTLMKACGTDYYRAKALMDEMKTMGLSPNHVSWSILIDICGGSGNVEGSIQILKTMREAGIKPDVIAYTTAIKVCVESKSLNMAFSLYAEMRRSRVQANLVTYNTLLRARTRYGSLHEVQQCLAIYQDMRKAGYNSNDYYLKELIEEWCEGVIQGNQQNQRRDSLVSSTDSGRSESLVLEKVGAHLRKSATESLMIDVQGLSQVEARIVVLAALRMIKENYTLGQELDDDILVILGAKEVGMGTSAHTSVVKDAIMKLLQNELRLEVVLAKTPVELDQIRYLRRGLDSELGSSARRPTDLERLKVTKKSLYEWLQRRQGTVRR